MPKQNKKEIETTGRIIAEAFLHYPLMKYAFEGMSEERRAKHLLTLYTKCVKASAMYGGVITRPDDLGAVIWLPGENFTLTLAKEIRSGMATIPLLLGPKATLRLMNHDSESEGWIKKNAAPGMAYIWCIGVVPAAQGRGYSRTLIDQCIDQMRQLGHTECWLKTEDPKNVTIYQKLGFTLMNEMMVKSSGIPSWAMRKMIV
jgi:ribosomal protein S18 acetylase RimI-like enzyme